MRVFIILSLLVGIYAQAETNCQHDAKTFRCVEYVKNYDADTVTFNIKGVHPLIGEKISVRVNGLDAPEIKGKQPCEKEAARAAQRLVQSLLKNAKVINLENLGRDKYFRILADVVIDGQNLTAILLKNRLGYTYHGETKQKVNWCEFGKRATASEPTK